MAQILKDYMNTTTWYMLNMMTCIGSCWALSAVIRPKEFVYLHEIDPTICVSLRYATCENFTGQPVPGYKNPVALLTKQAAEALKKVQADIKKDGYSLVVYDAYRPQEAVDAFVQWSKTTDQSKKAYYYPRVDKANIIKLGYVAARSGHSRGSTVDVTLIKTNQKIHEVRSQKRRLLDGSTILFLDDGSVDMGSSFDLFDEASHGNSTLVDKKYQQVRQYLKTALEKHGFKGYAKEWWHFTLANEPFAADKSASYFNFVLE